ncbi:MAG TPA: hypothetical protein VLN59_14315 [Burkholderiales bacterium]|nr:hypothetical protein [Burkholderiales bacterium]
MFVEFFLPAFAVCAPGRVRDAAEELLLVACCLEVLEFGDALARAFGARRFGFGALVVPVTEFVEQEFGHVLVDRELLERIGGLLIEEAFRVVGAALVAGVVRVLLFLAVADEEAVALVAGDDAGVREGVLALAGSRAAGERVLYVVEECSGDEWFVFALVGFAAPAEGAGVHGVAQEDGDVALRDGFAASAAQAALACEFCEIVEAVCACCSCFEEFDDERRLFVVGRDAFGRAHVLVAQGCPGGPSAFLGFFVHAFFHFFAEVLDVVFCHEHAHAGEEAHAGVRVGSEDRALLDEVHAESEAFECAVVLEVAREAVDLLNDEGSYYWMLVEEREHVAKARSAGALRGFVVAEFANDAQVFALGVIAQEVTLRRNAEALLCLFLAAHARVEDGLFTRGRRLLAHVLLRRQHAVLPAKKQVTRIAAAG